MHVWILANTLKLKVAKQNFSREQNSFRHDNIFAWLSVSSVSIKRDSRKIKYLPNCIIMFIEGEP